MSSGIFVLIERGLGWNLIRSIFSTIDVVIFWLFNKILQATFDIAGLELVSEAAFEQFQNRVYVILGIFMLFKVTISMLKYLVNPDKLNDKEAGLGKMVSRTIVTLCMLVAFPRVFNLLYRAQEPLLEAVPRIIIGKTANNGDVGSQMDSTANKITWTVYSVVFNENGNEVTEFNNIEVVPDHVNDPTDDNSVYKYNYWPLIGAVIGAVMSFIMAGMCIDIAIRAFKLVILRMLAPIPIISYIDPKSAKDGTFNNWLKSLTSTWLDLFIKMGILYFIIYMIDLIILQGNIDFGGITGVRKLFVIIIIIIGLLFFARQAPKFITDALGIKNSKGLGAGLGGALAAGGALLGGAGIAGAIKASGDYANEAADAAAQGKAAGPAWSKGRDIAAQIRTGDKNARGKPLSQRATDLLMKANAATHGITKKSVKDTKAAMYNAKDAASNAAVFRNKFMEKGGAAFDASEQNYIKANYAEAMKQFGLSDNIASWSASDWNNVANFEATNAAKLEKRYQKLEYYAANRGVVADEPIPKELGVNGFRRFDKTERDRPNVKKQNNGNNNP